MHALCFVFPIAAGARLLRGHATRPNGAHSTGLDGLATCEQLNFLLASVVLFDSIFIELTPVIDRYSIQLKLR